MKNEKAMIKGYAVYSKMGDQILLPKSGMFATKEEAIAKLIESCKRAETEKAEMVEKMMREGGFETVENFREFLLKNYLIVNLDDQIETYE